MAKSRQVILVLVEGPSDETTLIPPLKSILAKQGEVRSQPLHCDVTTLRLYPSYEVPFKGDAPKTVREFVKRRIEERREYRLGDLKQIIQIVDLDGAFIDDSRVMDSGGRSLRYEADRILADDVERIRRRNQEKARQLKKLSSMEALTINKRPIPYRVYFMSRNLEHAFYGIAEDVKDEKKEELSRAFQRKYLGDADGFKALLKRLATGLGDTYPDTWKSVQDGTRSLERGSNLRHVFDGFDVFGGV